jgi:HSP20 family protein
MPSLHDELEALRRRLTTQFGPAGFQPPVDVFAAGDPPHTLGVRVEIAGLDTDSVAIHLDGRLLTIAGQRPPGHRQRVSYQHMEIDYGPFERRIELPADVDAGGASAEYSSGFLTVTLPIAQRPHRAAVVVVRVMR